MTFCADGIVFVQDEVFVQSRATYKLANACGYCDKLMRYPDIYISSSAQSLRESIIAFAGKVAVMEKQMAGVDFDFRQPAQSVAPQPAPVTA